MEWYNSTTYDPEEIVRFSKLVKGEEELKKEDGAVIVDGINSWLFGRCARLSFPLVRWGHDKSTHVLSLYQITIFNNGA